MGEQVTIYRYGLLAWLWRTLMAGFLIGGVICLVFGTRTGQPALLFMAIVLLAPALFFGAVVAVRVDRLDDGEVRVWTLLFWRRRLSPEQIGPPRQGSSGWGDSGPPGLWVPVRRGLPIYFDPLADIPDQNAFAATVRLPRKDL
jgi:hypothetical protein